ncbi:MAG: hypothetical protein IT451_08300 [Candidatus Brocadia sp.]|nr:hypothetical protein [Candidatus Brocadia sp.]
MIGASLGDLLKDLFLILFRIDRDRLAQKERAVSPAIDIYDSMLATAPGA